MKELTNGQKYGVRQKQLEGAKKRLLKLYPNLPDRTGIYILTRTDENGMRFGYIGQTKAKGGILGRMAEHLLGYQHIDLSLRKHKFIGEAEYGYDLDWFECLESELDAYEQEYILKYANMGYQLRNKNSGGNKGKVGFEDDKPRKTYHDGLKQGYQNCLKDIKEYFDKYLEFRIKRSQEALRKPKNKAEKRGDYGILFKEIYIKKYSEFKNLLEGENDDGEGTN